MRHSDSLKPPPKAMPGRGVAASARDERTPVLRYRPVIPAVFGGEDLGQSSLAAPREDQLP